jgi:hypothetical protein
MGRQGAGAMSTSETTALIEVAPPGGGRPAGPSRIARALAGSLAGAGSGVRHLAS